MDLVSFGGFDYHRLRDTPLPEFEVICEEVERVAEARKQALRKRG